jgi:hypothetical protein
MLKPLEAHPPSHKYWGSCVDLPHPVSWHQRFYIENGEAQGGRSSPEEKGKEIHKDLQ